MSVDQQFFPARLGAGSAQFGSGATSRLHGTIGADAICGDGFCGVVTGVVEDKVAGAVAYFVVEPYRRGRLRRLVPTDLVDARGDEIRLRCTLAVFDGLNPAEVARSRPDPRRQRLRTQRP